MMCCWPAHRQYSCSIVPWPEHGTARSSLSGAAEAERSEHAVWGQLQTEGVSSLQYPTSLAAAHLTTSLAPAHRTTMLQHHARLTTPPRLTTQLWLTRNSLTTWPHHQHTHLNTAYRHLQDALVDKYL
jgi:hypothetical protein